MSPTLRIRPDTSSAILIKKKNPSSTASKRSYSARHKYTKKEVKVLEKHFKAGGQLDKEHMKKISEKTKLSKSQISRWIWNKKRSLKNLEIIDKLFKAKKIDEAKVKSCFLRWHWKTKRIEEYLKIQRDQHKRKFDEANILTVSRTVFNTPKNAPKLKNAASKKSEKIKSRKTLQRKNTPNRIEPARERKAKLRGSSSKRGDEKENEIENGQEPEVVQADNVVDAQDVANENLDFDIPHEGNIQDEGQRAEEPEAEEHDALPENGNVAAAENIQMPMGNGGIQQNAENNGNEQEQQLPIDAHHDDNMVFTPNNGSLDYQNWTTQQVVEFVRNFIENENVFNILTGDNIDGSALAYHYQRHSGMWESIGIPNEESDMIISEFLKVIRAAEQIAH